jgi:hypothetical protein
MEIRIPKLEINPNIHNGRSPKRFWAVWNFGFRASDLSSYPGGGAHVVFEPTPGID